MSKDLILDPKFSTKSLRNGITSSQLKQYFLHSFDIYQYLFSLIKQEKSFYTKPQPLRHPLIFYYGHTASFFINKLVDKGLLKQRIDPKMQTIFAVGVDEMDWDDLDETHYDWPQFNQVKTYREKVKGKVLQIIDKISLEINWNSDAWVIMMGIEHQKIHLQTSAVIIRRLPIQQIKPSNQLIDCPLTNLCPQQQIQNTLRKVKISEIKWQRGQKEKTDYYGWDNQFGIKYIKCNPFEASTMLVSNQEYMQFVRDNGYQRLEFWDKQGQAWIRSTKTKHPVFWVKDQNHKFKLRTINKIMQMPLDWPVEVNNLEATAFCNWKSSKFNKKVRLPTEDEYMQLRQIVKEDHFDWEHGKIANINMQNWLSPCPVNLFQHEGFYDIIGNVWQHCSTPTYPFKNFQIHPIYEDFTTPTFDGRHYMIKGGSFMSCGNQSFKYSRYAFRRHFYQFAGFRYVHSEFDPQIPHILKDESDQKVHEYIKIHYLEENSYIQKSIELIRDNCAFKDEKFIHVGCTVGRVVLELSKEFKASFGTDFSARFFQIATRMVQKGSINYQQKKLSLETIRPVLEKINLYQMNPENPDPKKLNGFKVAMIDGIALKTNSIKKVLNKFLSLMSPQAFILIINCQNNRVSLEDMLAMDKSVQLIKTQKMQYKCDTIEQNLYKVNHK